ncbi:MAG: hypothetical protein GF330_13465 [Candidatus Eisenbacteria bacterium]|nr:hypothetical protein [Candidatus Eisenbacteria bacterium]
MEASVDRIPRQAGLLLGLLGLIATLGVESATAAPGETAAPTRGARGSWLRAHLVATPPGGESGGSLTPMLHGATLSSQAPRGAVGAGRSAARASRPVPPSRLKAIGASLLLPGWGQLLTGHRDRARIYLSAEAAILIGYVAFTVQGAVRKNSYIEYAERFGGLTDADDRPDWYYRNLGEYDSSGDYVDDIERTARAIYGNDLAQRQAYVDANAPRPDEEWAWRSTDDRLEYRARRKASRNSYRSATHTLGVALLNRLISAVDAAISASRSQRDHALYYQPTPDGGGYLCMRWMFD